jgi:putative SOS response-associated peptidase YedK
MCGRYVFTSPAEAMLRLFGLEIPASSPSRFNMAPGQFGWIARAGEQGLEAAQARWGLVPGWSKDPAIAFKTINARSETAAGFRQTPFTNGMARKRQSSPICSMQKTGRRWYLLDFGNVGTADRNRWKPSPY